MRSFLLLHTKNTGGIELFDGQEKISQFFSENNISFSDHFFSGNPEDLDFNELEQQFDFSALLIVGGDGTFRRVAQRMYDQQKNYELAFYPSGSANVLAKMYAIPSSLEYLKNPQITKIGAGMMNEKHLFFIAVVFGSVAKISLDAPKLGKKWWGFFAYVLGFIKNLSLSFRKNVVLGEKNIRCHSILVCSPQFASFLLPPQNVRENFFSALFVKNKTALGVFRILFDLFARKKISPLLITEQKENLDFSADFGTTLHIDGDYVTETFSHFSFEYLPEKFSLLVPQV
jgi:diacylglycerol kinase family enzyme